MMETTSRYKVMLRGEVFGELYYNMRGFVGCLPLPGGQKLDIGERPIAEFRREVARINREFREAEAAREGAPS